MAELFARVDFRVLGPSAIWAQTPAMNAQAVVLSFAGGLHEDEAPVSHPAGGVA